MQWLECTVPGGDDPEELCNALAELGVGGMSIENERDFHDFLENNRACWDYVDEALEESFSGVSRVKFWLSCDAEGEKVLAAVRAASVSKASRHMRVVAWLPVPKMRPGSSRSATRPSAGCSSHAGTTTSFSPMGRGL